MGGGTGAIFPLIMGFISDHSTIRGAFIVPLICQAYVLYFTVRGYRSVLVAGLLVAGLSTVKMTPIIPNPIQGQMPDWLSLKVVWAEDDTHSESVSGPS
jgi:hypothetical protein